jgi:hypothetical protein
MTKPTQSNRLIRDKTYYYFFLAAILGLSLSIRLIGLSKGIWLDEFISIDLIQKGGLYGTLSAARADVHPPLYYLFLELWSGIRMSEEFLRLCSVIFGIGTIVVVMVWLKRYSNLASVLAGLSFATIPIMLRYSQEIRGYSLLVFATALSFLFASRLLAQPERLSGYLGLAFSLTIAVSTHLVGVMLLIPLYAFLIISSIMEKRKIYHHRAILAMILPSLAFIYFNFVYLKDLDKLTENWWMSPVSWQLIDSVIKSLLGHWAIYGVLQRVIPKTMYYFYYPIPPLFLLALIGLPAVSDWRRGIPLLLAFMIYWLEIIVYSLFKKPIFIDRTLLPSLVPFFGLLALQISTIRLKWIKEAYIIGFILVCLVFTTNWIIDQAWKPLEEWQGVSNSLKSKWKPGDLVVFYPSFVEGPIRYYFADLPDECVIKVDRMPDMKKLEEEIDQWMAFQSGLGYQPSIFLISRNDPIVQKNPEVYEHLSSMLESKSKKRGVIDSMTIE